MDEYTIKNVIGEGAQGIVYAVEDIKKKKQYAMKVCCTPQENVNAALSEIKVLLKLDHPHVVSYVDFFFLFNNSMLRDKFQKGVENLPHKNSMDGEERLLSLQNMQTSKRDLTDRLSTTHWLRDDEVAVCLVVELCGNGDLADFIKKAKSKIFETGKHPVAEADVLKWAAQCAQALQYIHESGFCHRDIKPTNIFFDEQQNVKLGDFGLATTVGLGRRSAVGTPQYLAPELLLNEVYDGKIDVWGLGAVLLELLTMEERNVNAMVLNNPKCVDDLVKKITRYGFSEKLSNLVKDMLQRHADKRPTAAAILTRIRQMQMAASPSSLGLSMSFGGMSCPKLGEQKCDWCEERIATIICPSCKAIYCAECDIVGHRHHARKSHERTSLQQSGSDSQSTVSRGRPSPSERSVSNASSGRRYSLGMTCNNLSVSDFSITHTLTRSSVAESSIVRVPRDFDTLDLAVSRVASMPEVRKIIVAGGTVINTSLKLTQSLPENIKIIGENPSPVIEVQGEPFVIHCASGKGVIENFIIRHTGRGRTALKALEPNSAVQAEKNAKTPHPNAVCITGGEWWLHKCRISCIEGSGVSVGSNALNNTAENTKIKMEEVDPKITKCTFIDVTIAGIDVLENARGSYEGNNFSGCGYVAFILRKNSAPRFRANQITDCIGNGIFCHNSSGTIEYNLVAKNKGIGVVVRGSHAAPMIRKNRILSNEQAGIFCNERCHPVIQENEIKQNSKAGVLIKTGATPTVLKNTIEEGKEAGVYVFEEGAGIIQENIIRGNRNAGLLVTTKGSPHVIKNVLSKNSYEGIWICKKGGGTFCDNDLRGNLKGCKDIEKNCNVTWVGNTES